MYVCYYCRVLDIENPNGFDLNSQIWSNLTKPSSLEVRGWWSSSWIDFNSQLLFIYHLQSLPNLFRSWFPTQCHPLIPSIITFQIIIHLKPNSQKPPPNIVIGLGSRNPFYPSYHIHLQISNLNTFIHPLIPPLLSNSSLILQRLLQSINSSLNFNTLIKSFQLTPYSLNHSNLISSHLNLLLVPLLLLITNTHHHHLILFKCLIHLAQRSISTTYNLLPTHPNSLKGFMIWSTSDFQGLSLTISPIYILESQAFNLGSQPIRLINWSDSIINLIVMIKFEDSWTRCVIEGLSSI